MNLNYWADRKESIPTIVQWYFNEWGYKVDENLVEEISRKPQKYLNRDQKPIMLLAVSDEDVIGVAELKYQEMDIYPENEHWIGGIFYT